MQQGKNVWRKKVREIEQSCEFASTINCHTFLERRERQGNGSMVFGNGFVSADVLSSEVANGISNSYYLANNGKHHIRRPNVPRTGFDLTS